ncbi:sensor histidine kinase [Candidatus Symbiobacter mobilis]|uniref:Signal transduction histidine kinase n=1 Tax=Candidatus Symbiobacter mobilis CR TaxID=946483 RepID=U5N9X2_9BURK|nr:HAMP domain-containing sensor histidine kinase [Candidatus Symbiobacter mobilis]AGX87053.1 signal transduction histidine kinase [Candidatus Symbiobacter mobilis CR]
MTAEEISFTDLIASSIHDMKNSVNIQVSALECMALDAQSRGDRDSFKTLVGVIAQAYRMNANLIQLLTLYKFGKAIYPLDISEQSVRDVIDEALLQTHSMMDFKGISVQVDCDPGCYWYFDKDLLSGVLLNALNNAFNYTKDQIRIAAIPCDGGLCLRVEDNGSGYPESMLHCHGVCANKSSNFYSGSTGLGFYFSAQVAKMHQNGGRCGSLTIENGGLYGGGCFVVQLP